MDLPMFKDLDEYTLEEIEQEVIRRVLCQVNSKCDYCGRAFDTTPCKFKERHTYSPRLSEIKTRTMDLYESVTRLTENHP